MPYRERHYSWLVDEMEQLVKLCYPLEAKRHMGLTNKTDRRFALREARLFLDQERPVRIPTELLVDMKRCIKGKIATLCFQFSRRSYYLLDAAFLARR